MQKRRRIDPKIIPGKSVTRFHLVKESSLSDFEIHVAHHDNGDLGAEAQWYEIYERPSADMITLIKERLEIPAGDWKILEQILGSFSWALYEHSHPQDTSRIMVDEVALRSGEWTTTYF